MRQPPTGTITFLFTDIEGSTKLWERQPQVMGLALVRHDQLLRAAITDNAGYVFKTIGDAFCAAFATAPDALRAAIAAQTSLTNEPWGTEIPVRVRMALHTGAAEERDGDFFGQPLNRVARLLSAGYGGQTLLSGVTQELTQDHLPASVTLRDLGQRRLKDLGRPEHVFQVYHPALLNDFPSLRSLDNPDLPNNLPQHVTSFIGREKQVAEVMGLLGKTRLLTLTGSGGSGKTRLSLQIAADLLDQYFDGVWLVELAALSDPGLVPQAVADVLDVREEPGRSLQKTLINALKTKRLLLVLDNCEHLIAVCAALADDLLRSCPGVHILASSREALNVAGEQTYRVPSLSLPDPKKTQTVETLSQFEAVRLFIERAQSVQSTFAVTNSNAPAVAQVCWRLDGIPLAIELAAARVRSLPVEEINTRLDNRFRLLTGGSRTALPRQQTLRALIDWSYDLLTDSEKTLLRRLSVFAGGWTLAAAEGVCSGDVIEDWEILDLLTSLVDKSLVTYEEGAGDGDRYRLLETVRQYAGDRLAESSETEAVRERSASWFLGLAEEAEPQLTGPDQASWLSRLEMEHDNLRASLSWYQNPSEQEAGLRLAGALWRFWSVRGHASEGGQWLGRTLTMTGKERSAGTAGRAKAAKAAGNLALQQGDYPGARAMYEEGLTVYRQVGDQLGIAASLGNLGNLAAYQSDYAAARPLLEEGLSLYRQLGFHQGIPTSLNSLANVILEQGDHEAAKPLYEECLILYRQLGSLGGAADILSNLGNVASQQGDYAGALALYEECLTLNRQLGNQSGIAWSMSYMAHVASQQGDYPRARTLYEESRPLFRRLEEMRGVAVSLDGLGNVALQQGAYAEARALYTESLTISRQMGHQKGIAASLEGMAAVAQGQNDLSRAVRSWAAASALRERIGNPLPLLAQETRDKTIASVRDIMGEGAFASAWNAGRAMTLEDAVAYALGDS